MAVTLHNIPEGMAVGVVYAGYLSGNIQINAMAAAALSIGIAIQNFPEGAIISMPLRSEGVSRGKAFLYGALSGIVEPIGDTRRCVRIKKIHLHCLFFILCRCIFTIAYPKIAFAFKIAIAVFAS